MTTMDRARTLKRVVMPHVQKVAYRAALSDALARRRHSPCVLICHGVAPVEAEIFQERMQFLARNLPVEFARPPREGKDTLRPDWGMARREFDPHPAFADSRAATFAERMHRPQT